MITNIIFDFGGVIHRIRYENVEERMAYYGVKDNSGFYSKDHQTHEMDLFEKGLLSVADFRDYMRGVVGMLLSDAQIDDIVNAILIDVPRERVEMLLQLRKRYRTFLFSNTNQINYDCFTARLWQQYGFDIFSSCFERAYFSQFMHTRKPSPEGFRQIMQENGLIADETLFIDDIAKNADAARMVGLHAHHLVEPDFCSLFDSDLSLLPNV